jgi:hypothetical protein
LEGGQRRREEQRLERGEQGHRHHDARDRRRDPDQQQRPALQRAADLRILAIEDHERVANHAAGERRRKDDHAERQADEPEPGRTERPRGDDLQPEAADGLPHLGDRRTYCP